MFKNCKKIVAAILAFVFVMSFSTIASAASYDTNFGKYTAPSSSDYAYWSGSKVVKASGTTTKEIQWMQAAMNYCIKCGYIKCSYLAVDGSFGPASQTVCKAFQKKAGLTQDGSFGPGTIDKMKKVLPTLKDPDKTTSSTTSKSTTTSDKIITSSVTYTLNAVSFEDFKKKLEAAERSALGFSSFILTFDGQQIYTGNCIEKVTVLSWKTIKIQNPSFVGPCTSNYGAPTISLKIPNEIKFDLHKHTYANKMTAESVGRYVAGLVEQKITTTFTCSCGASYSTSWEMPDLSSLKSQVGDIYQVTVKSTRLK